MDHFTAFPRKLRLGYTVVNLRFVSLRKLEVYISVWAEITRWQETYSELYCNLTSPGGKRNQNLV